MNTIEYCLICGSPKIKFIKECRGEIKCLECGESCGSPEGIQYHSCGWISSEERLPPRNTFVLISCNSKSMHLAELRTDDFYQQDCWFSDCGVMLQNPPSHWMPLPSHP